MALLWEVAFPDDFRRCNDWDDPKMGPRCSFEIGDAAGLHPLEVLWIENTNDGCADNRPLSFAQIADVVESCFR